MTVKKKMIFVAAPPASGKTYVSERLGGGRRPAGAGPTWALCAGSGPRSGGGRAAPERTRAGAFAPAQVGTRSAQKGPGSREAEAGANSPRDPGPGIIEVLMFSWVILTEFERSRIYLVHSKNEPFV